MYKLLNGKNWKIKNLLKKINQRQVFGEHYLLQMNLMNCQIID